MDTDYREATKGFGDEQMKKVLGSLLVGVICLAVLLAGMGLFYRKMENDWNMTSAGARVFDRHYVLISNDESVLWQSIYESAKQRAEEENVYLEWMGKDMLTAYSNDDCLKIAISSDVDGIILYPDGSSRQNELIQKAKENNIPVVTVLADTPESARISHVGINNYQMGETYGEWLLDSLNEGRNRVMILMGEQSEEVNKNLIYSQLYNIVENGKKENQDVEIQMYSVDASLTFEAEEVIRDIFLNGEIIPDILICTDSVSTERAYQAIIDFNKVENVEIVGYYITDTILDAIEKGLIPATLVIDTDQMGSLCVDALNEYLQYGHVSNYYNVRLNWITRDNVRQYREQQDA